MYLVIFLAMTLVWSVPPSFRAGSKTSVDGVSESFVRLSAISGVVGCGGVIVWMTAGSKKEVSQRDSSSFLVLASLEQLYVPLVGDSPSRSSDMEKH